MRIRIFALAKELDMDSKVLMDFCAKAGIIVKNSALASISPEERDSVLALMKQAEGGGSGTSAPATTAPVVTPMREQAPDLASRVRTIRTMTARPQPSRIRPPAANVPTEVMADQGPEREPVAHSEVDTTPVATEPSAQEHSQPQLVEVEEAPLEPAPETVQEPVAESEAASAPVMDDQTAEGGETAAAASTEVPAGPTRPSPITRADYTSPSGAGRNMRMMTARGTSDTSPQRAQPTKPAPVKKPAGPIIASLGEFKPTAPKAPKPEEAKAQKPTLTWSQQGQAAQQGASPLQDHLRKSQDIKKRRVEDDGPVDARGKRGVGDRSAVPEDSRLRRIDKRRTGTPEEERDGGPGQRQRFRMRGKKGAPTQLKTTAEIDLPITVRSLSEAMGRTAKQIIQVLWDQGEMVTINTALDEETALEIAMELGVELTVTRPKDVEEELLALIDEPDDPELPEVRPPIVTILGHVDHGKTTLIDRLRSSNVAGGEHGGITQHIAAYQVQHNGQRLTFVDTPGHAAFSEMRSRGANVTDIVVLVVAANDGVMPQTIECIAHARAAGVPLVVAMNKMDLADKNEQRVLQELAAQDVLAAEWGGDVEVVRTSGLTGEGLTDLLDTLLLTSELHEFKASPHRDAVGTCIEGNRDEGRGPMAWMIVQKGTLRVGDVILCGETHGRVRMIFNENDEEVQEALPSTPIKVSGLDQVPNAGDRFVVLNDIELARDIAQERKQVGRAASLAARGGRRTLDDVLNAAREGQISDLNLVVKADTPGSLEALRSELGKFEHPEVRMKILHTGIGGVNESDVYLAAASEAIIVAFHVVPEDRAAQLASQEEVEIRRYNIIYEVIDDMRVSLEGLLKPALKEVVTGRAIVLQTFSISRYGTIAGCRVLNGNIERNNRIHLIRDQKVLNSYGIASLRREKEDVRDVREGMECGIRLDGFNDIKEGDLLEAYKIEEIKRKLEDSR